MDLGICGLRLGFVFVMVAVAQCVGCGFAGCLVGGCCCNMVLFCLVLVCGGYELRGLGDGFWFGVG